MEEKVVNLELVLEHLWLHTSPLQMGTICLNKLDNSFLNALRAKFSHQLIRITNTQLHLLRSEHPTPALL